VRLRLERKKKKRKPPERKRGGRKKGEKKRMRKQRQARLNPIIFTARPPTVKGKEKKKGKVQGKKIKSDGRKGKGRRRGKSRKKAWFNTSTTFPLLTLPRSRCCSKKEKKKEGN